jgi:MerR family transcriptional regulator, redox-sensitive transcriptional activator SoxR
MPASASLLTVGDLATRAGVAVSALHYYESRGLIQAERSSGNQRRYSRAMLRRVAFIRAAQQLGIGLAEIGAALASLPQQRTPTKADWARLSAGWRAGLEARIAALQALRDRLDGCIGCGCLSLRACALWNPADQCGALGSGAQRLLPAPPAGRHAPRKKPGTGPG